MDNKRKAAEKLKEQGRQVEIKRKLKGKELIGKNIRKSDNKKQVSYTAWLVRRPSSSYRRSL